MSLPKILLCSRTMDFSVSPCLPVHLFSRPNRRSGAVISDAACWRLTT